MRVRCSFCGVEYEAAVTPAALILVDRCERCGRARLRPVENGERRTGESTPACERPDIARPD
jgi:hypothetical protein